MIVRELFTRYDTDNNLFLDPREFKNLMTDLQSDPGPLTLWRPALVVRCSWEWTLISG